MRLPDPIYQELKIQMAHHAPWHLARIPRQRLPPQALPDWDAARQMFPAVRFLDQSGCGEEFLRFHRVMVQQYRWILDQNPQASVTYLPWSKRVFPDWLERRFSPGCLAAARTRIDELIQNGSADQLGSFIEATGLDRSTVINNIHNLAHGKIADHEESMFPGDPRLDDAGMGSPDTAHHNEHFWSLHGWIDELFAEWQRAHGEPVDQSPQPPIAAGHGHLMPSAFSSFALVPEVVIEVEFSEETRRFFREIVFGGK